MSYSFQVKGESKEEAIDAVRVKLAEVVAQQPVHAIDRDQALAAAVAVISVLPGGADRGVSVSVSGSLGWTGTYPDSHVITSAQVSVYALLMKRE